ncbi:MULTISPECIES: hypothetical protein [Dickeya]|uniref:hypothetical protein n=1 Tax=Dickeya TaxID=204037 RepID=UPI00063D311F|nr:MULTISPECIES: hypothetical protein [Dickeya]MZG45153.1 hypothetical protein [Dickeya dianthicola]MZH99900.1 hypothetical protein [Dickeya dianthicola]WOY02049.1 hypothetical protein OGM22_09735 [Dickeya fangzhongdai]
MSDKRLTKQRLFCQSVRFPVISGFYFGVFSWIGHEPKFNSDGFLYFIEISKLPIGMISLAIPFVAIVSSIHRTIQTEAQMKKIQKQIDMATKKNRSDSYIAHFKTCSDIFKTLPSFILSRKSEESEAYFHIEVSVSHSFLLYKKIFSESSMENGYSEKVDDSFMRKTSSNYMNINMIVSKLLDADVTALIQIECIESLENVIISLCRDLGVNYQRESHLFCVYEPLKDKGFVTSFSSEKEIKQMLRGLRDILIHLYTLIDQSPEIFQTGRNLGDVIPDYSYDEDKKIFPDILPTNVRSKG